MSKWHDLQLHDRLTEILCEFGADETHHFGRPFASAYQIAIAFAGRYPDLFERIGLPLGGPGTGKHNSLTQYLAGELSRRIKSGEITHIEGAWLSTLRLHQLEFDSQGDLLNVPTPQEVLSMFRLTEQGLRALDRQRYEDAVAAGRRERLASKARQPAKAEEPAPPGDQEQGECAEQLELF
jgi:hypothetical protein